MTRGGGDENGLGRAAATGVLLALGVALWSSLRGAGDERRPPPPPPREPAGGARFVGPNQGGRPPAPATASRAERDGASDAEE